MEFPFICRAALGKDYIPGKKVRYIDPGVYSRTLICLCVFVILILILLHCSNLDSSSTLAKISPSSSYVNPAASHAIKGPKIVANPPFKERTPTFSSLIDAESLPADSIYSQKPLAPSLNSVKLPVLHAQKSSPSASTKDVQGTSFPVSILASRTALQGLGTLFVRGTIAVSELVVAHVDEGTSVPEIRMFLRTFHRSGMSARSDVVFLFPSNGLLAAMEQVILEEHRNLCKLLSQNNQNLAQASSNSTISPFQYNAFGRPGSYNSPIWGRGPIDYIKSSKKEELGDGLVEFGFGSIVGFDVSEVNPDNSLQGFIDDPPLELRRWPCYQMLLGMAKHEFKQVLLTAVSGVLILGDPLATARRKAGLFFSLRDITWGSTITMIEGDIEGKVESHEGYEEAMQGASQDIEDNMDAMHTSMIISHSSIGLKNQQHIKLKQGAQGMIALSSESLKQDGDLDSRHKYEKSSKQANQHSMGTVQKNRKGYTQRRVRQRRKTQKESGKGVGLYESVYGRVMWNMLDNEEKNKRLVNSAAIVGDMRHIRGVVNTMVTEIVKVALQRGSREAFFDNVLLSHIVHKSNVGVLGKKVLEHLHLLDNSASFVHSLSGSHEPSSFLQKGSQQAYPMISDGQCNSRLWNHVMDLIHEDICSSSADAIVYNDCLQQ